MESGYYTLIELGIEFLIWIGRSSRWSRHPPCWFSYHEWQSYEGVNGGRAYRCVHCGMTTQFKGTVS